MSSEEKFLGNAAEIYLFLMILLVIIYSFSACILLIYSMYKNRQIKNINNLPTIFSAIFYFISSVVSLSALAYFNENDNENFEHDKKFATSMVLFLLFLVLAKLSVYTQFLTRLYATFRHSTLELSKSTIIVSITLICLLFTTVLWWMSLLITRYLTLNRPFTGYSAQFYPVFVFLFIFEASLSWLFVGLFTNKLLKSIMFKSRSAFFEKTGRYLNATKKTKEETPASASNCSNDSSSPNSTKPLEIQTTSIDYNEDKDEQNEAEQNEENEDNDDNEENKEIEHGEEDKYDPKQRQKSRTDESVQRRSSFLIDLAFASIDQNDKERLDVVTRYFMLSSLNVITSQLFYISLIIALIVVSISDHPVNQNVAVAIYGGVFYPIEVIFNCTALYLNFQFAKEHYNKFCRPCHERCSLFVVRRASQNILRKHSAELTTINIHKSMPDK